ncbi:MAG: DsbA family protein [Patescibacteria group bacterium]
MTNKGFLTIPMAIVVAGIIIAIALIYASPDKPAGEPLAAIKNAVSGLDNINPVTANDHIFGNPNAPIKIVEFSDTECPFCASFHPTMKRIVKDYNGQVAWVYRHFPLDSIHPKARKEAEATECAAGLGGNDAFWEYLNRIFEITPSNNGLDPTELFNVAEYIGLNHVAFEECLNSGKYTADVEKDYRDALASGAQGTPYSIIIAPKGQKSLINGAQSYSSIKQMVDDILK